MYPAEISMVSPDSAGLGQKSRSPHLMRINLIIVRHTNVGKGSRMTTIQRVASVLLLTVFGSVALSQSQSNQQVELLNKRIVELEKTIEVQQAEIERLRALCVENGIDINPKQVIKPTPDAISKAMFGVFLGESIDSLKKRFRLAESTYHFTDEDHPGIIWSVSNDNPNVKELLVYTFNGQVYTIDIRFSDGSRTNYHTIKDQLEKKYKRSDEGGLPGALFGEGVFKPVIDGVEVRIKLDHDIGIMEDDKLKLCYTHGPLNDQVYKAIQKRKAAKINSEL